MKQLILTFTIFCALPRTIFGFCPSGCVCDDSTDYPMADCSEASLSSIPMFLNPRLKRLNLQGNKLSAITVDELSFYTELDHLDLSDNQILRIDRNSFFKLGKLRYLSLRRNLMQRLELETFAGLRALESLDLSDNAIARLPTSVFVDTRNLLKLNVSYNDLGDVSPGAFTGLDQLRTLVMHDNQLTEIPQIALRSLPSLESLHLAHNSLSTIHNLSFDQLNRLEVLDLSMNRIDRIDENGLIGLQNLRTLRLNANRLRTVPTASFQVLTELTVLNLDENMFNELATSSFEGLARLRMLSIRGCTELKRVALNAFSGLHNLEVLDLADNTELSHIDAMAFERPNVVREFSVNNCNLHSLSQNLLDWVQLNDLDLTLNPWRCDCDMRWIPETLAHLNEHNGVTEAKCLSPDEAQNSPLLDMPTNTLSCTTFSMSPYMHLALLGITLFAITLLVIIVLRFHEHLACCHGRDKQSPDDQGKPVFDVDVERQSNFYTRSDLSAVLSRQQGKVDNMFYADFVPPHNSTFRPITSDQMNEQSLIYQVNPTNGYLTARSVQRPVPPPIPPPTRDMFATLANHNHSTANQYAGEVYCTIGDSPRSLRSTLTDETSLLPGAGSGSQGSNGSSGNFRVLTNHPVPITEL